MSMRRNIWLKGIMLLFLALQLAACGGSGGDARTSRVVDPALSYEGATSQATVTAGNAEPLVLGGFGGGGIAAGIGGYSVEAKSLAVNQTTVEHPVRHLTQVLKQAARRLDLPGKASQRSAVKPVAGKATFQLGTETETFQIQGDGGGVSVYTLNINNSTGSFTGSVEFIGYTSQGVVTSGKADILGALDASRQELSRLTLSFNSLTMSDGNSSFDLIGSLSWGFNFAAATETLAINMVLVDNADGQTYWFNNYELFTTYGPDYLTQTIAGRYYDPVHGYVDFTTQPPLIVYSGNDWPSQGRLLFAGQQGTAVNLSFAVSSLQIEADTDGNGTVDWQTQLQTNVQPPTNLAPIAIAGPDQNVSQWATVHLDGSASIDGNNDPLSYYWEFTACAQNSCPGLTGANTATPSFIAEQAGTYQLRLTVCDGQGNSSDTVNITAVAAVESSPDLLQEQWQYGLYGTYIGLFGLFTADLEGDGRVEIVATASTFGFDINVWYVVRQTAAGTYEQIWRSKPYPATMVRLLLADLSGDGKDDIVVGLTDGSVYIYDGPTRQEIRRLTAAANLTALAVADLDGDGTKEVVTSDGLGVFIYAADGSGLKWSLATGGGSSLAVGNVDGDAALEIVTATYGGKGYVIDGGSRAITWEYINGFGAQVALADLDGDGMQEIVAATWAKITIFDADRKTPVWEVATNLDISSLLVVDMDGDGVLDILYGDYQSEGIHSIDTQTKTEKWSINTGDSGVSGIALGDVDLDGIREILWGAGGSSSGPDFLYIANPTTKEIEWQSLHVDGPLSAVTVGDVDDDGADEIVMVSFESDSGYAEGVIHIFDARTHTVEYREKLGIQDWMGVRSVKIGDVDNDGKTEFVVTTGNIYDGVIQVYDGATHALKQQSAGYDGNFFTALAIGDVDGDGKTEIVAGQGQEHSGAQGVYLIVFDGATLQEKWRSVDLGSYWGGVYDIKLADLDGNGHAEIIASVGQSRLVVFDGVNHDLKLLIEHPARALTVADADGDGALELLAGRQDGQIDLFNGATLVLEKTVSAFSRSAIDALRVVDLDGNGTGEWLLTSGGVLTVLEGQDQGLKWRSRNLTGNLGFYNHLEVKDTDGDGRQEVFLGGDSALYQFE